MSLPQSASEDASHLLKVPESAAGSFDPDAARDFLPDPRIDWTTTCQFDGPVKRQVIESALNFDWQRNHGRPTIYGLAPETGRWTFVFAADAPGSFSRLKIAWPLWNAIADRPVAVSIAKLNDHRSAADNRLREIGIAAGSTTRSAEEALDSVQALSKIVAEYDQDVTLWLRSATGKPFAGREVRDVMLCLGLEYGDGDLFHWINTSRFGDDHFFTIQTSTPPGYFIPRQMADDCFDDLMFNFSIPRSADPLVVFDSMAKAIRYAQRRLGGEIVTEAGEAFDEDRERARVRSLVERLNKAGYTPGKPATCRVF